jgi:hypothetical protein
MLTTTYVDDVGGVRTEYPFRHNEERCSILPVSPLPGSSIRRHPLLPTLHPHGPHHFCKTSFATSSRDLTTPAPRRNGAHPLGGARFSHWTRDEQTLLRPSRMYMSSSADSTLSYFVI